MSKYGITLGYQKDKCSVCGFQKEIRVVYDKDNHLIVKVCDSCVESNCNKTTQEIIQQYGKKTTAKHIHILTKEQMEKAGFELTGKKN